METKKIIMAINGSMSSIMGAYLLKQQGHEIIGIGILFNTTKEDEAPLPPLLIRYNIPDISKVKELCDTFAIPFYAVHAEDRYLANVGDLKIASLVSCRIFADEIFATNLIIDILLEKCESLGGNAIATGHFAKISYNKENCHYIIGHSDDEKNDQSHLLAHLKQEHLSKLVLPLSTIKKDNVIKIADSLGVTFIEHSWHPEIGYSSELYDYMKKVIPPSFIKDITIEHYLTGEAVGEHSSLGLYPGQQDIVFINGKKMDTNLMVISYGLKKEKAFVCPKDELYYTHLLVEFSSKTSNYNISRPIPFFVKSRSIHPQCSCVVTVRNNNMAIVEFDQKRPGIIFPGEYLVFYNKKGVHGQIKAFGICCYSYFETSGMICPLPLKENQQNIYEKGEAQTAMEWF